MGSLPNSLSYNEFDENIQSSRPFLMRTAVKSTKASPGASFCHVWVKFRLTNHLNGNEIRLLSGQRDTDTGRHLTGHLSQRSRCR